MKIGLVSPFSLSYFGGVQTHIFALQKEFRRLGLETKILAPRQSPQENYGPNVLLLGYSFPLPGNSSRLDFSWGVPWETEKILKREKFDLLHFHGLSPFLGFQILEIAKRLKIINVFTFHANLDRSFLAQIFPLVPEFYFDYIHRQTNGAMAVSQASRKPLADFKVPVKIIANGVDLERFCPQGSQIHRFTDGAINLLFVGRLDERKGVWLILRAFRRLSERFKDLRLLIVGEGPLLGQLKREIRKWHLKNVELLGKVPEEELDSYYRTAHIFCAPSLGGESFGMVLLEAMASGLPVVASRIKGYKEVAQGLGSKLLFKTNEVGDLIKTLTGLLESEGLRRKYSVWGLREVQKYSWPKISQKVLSFYRQVSPLKIYV